MRPNPWIRTAPLACALTTAACASASPPPAQPPRLAMPALAAEPCALHVLPDSPTQADLEVGYLERGAQLAACESARRLAVETHAAEHELEDRWLDQARPSRRRWRLWPWPGR